MPGSPSSIPILAAFLGLFLGGAAIGLVLASAMAPNSWLAEVVSFFALPIVFAAGLQAWYGLALFSLIPRLLGWRGAGALAASSELRATPLPGSLVFVPIGSGAGGIAGLVVGLASSSHSVWLVARVYWLVGTVYGLVAWQLARRGFLLPPESL